jgi:hypothetical protein
MTERIGNCLGRAVEFPLVTETGFVEAASISRDLLPVVFLRDPDGITLSNIAHGLCHIECELAGFPRNLTNPNGRDPLVAKEILTEISSMIEHRNIYPKLIALGFDPHQEFVKLVERFFIPRLSESMPFSEMSAQTRSKFLSAQYARIRIESPDCQARTTVEIWYRKYAGGERQRGRRLASIIEGSDPYNPNHAKGALIACCRELGLRDEDYEVTFRFPKIETTHTASSSV